MRKMILSMFLVMGLGVAQMSAQDVTGGLKVEANMANFILNDMDNMKSKLGVGITVGGFGMIEFNDNFAFRPEVLLHYKNSVMENKTSGAEFDYQYFGVEIPLYAVAQIDMSGNKGFIGLGPYVGFGIDARYKADGMNDVKLFDEIGNTGKSTMQRWDFGAGVMLGYEFWNRIGINAGYKIGFLNALDTGSNSAKMLNQTISLGLSYRF